MIILESIDIEGTRLMQFRNNATNGNDLTA